MANELYVDGPNPVTADDLNQFCQGVGSYALLRNFIGTTLNDGSPMVCFLSGGETVNDGEEGFFYWSPISAFSDNGSTVIVPYGGTGAWLRILGGGVSTLVSHVAATAVVLTGPSTTALVAGGTDGHMTACSISAALVTSGSVGDAGINIKDGNGVTLASTSVGCSASPDAQFPGGLLLSLSGIYVPFTNGVNLIITAGTPPELGTTDVTFVYSA